MIREIWNAISSESGFEEYEFNVIEPPKCDVNYMSKCRKLCFENKCGKFGTNWGCPPGIGDEEECLELIKLYPKAVLLSRKFENVDVNDADKIADMGSGHQEICRRFANAMRHAGYKEVLPLGDGGCNYCGVCSYPKEPCKFPEQMVPSVSGFGICMDEYLNSNGIDFRFEDNVVTLYALILYEERTKG